jgi:hypothetical protein
MGTGEPFEFAGVRGKREGMHDPEETQFTDLPNGGIFRWPTFALVVAEQVRWAAGPSADARVPRNGHACKLTNWRSDFQNYE